MIKTDCECKEPGFCPRHQVEKDDRLFAMCQTNPGIFGLWERGFGPRQPAQYQEPVKQPLALAVEQVALYELLRPLAERLAEETGEPSVVPKALRYRQSLIKWKNAGFPVRDIVMRKAIIEKMCPGCCRYRKGTCGRCGGKGQLVAVMAWMATARCPGCVWELW